MYRKEFERVDSCEEGAKTAIGFVDMTGARRKTCRSRSKQESKVVGKAVNDVEKIGVVVEMKSWVVETRVMSVQMKSGVSENEVMGVQKQCMTLGIGGTVVRKIVQLVRFAAKAMR